jgi:hypothetical protein
MATKQSGAGKPEITVTDAEYAQAVAAGQTGEPRAQSVRFHRSSKRLQIELQDGVAVMIPTAFIQGLAGAPAKEIEAVELLADGYALHWPSLDADATVAGLVSGVFGTKQWMRELASGFLAQAGRKGGEANTPAKRAAARTNGKLGGRPRKKAIA